MFKKLDDQRRKLQKELRDIEKFSCVPKEFQENLKRVICNSSCKRCGAKKARLHASAPESPEDIATDTKYPGQKKTFAERQVPQQKKRCGSSKRSSCKKRSVSFFLSNKVDKNKMADAEMAAELQSLQAEERRGSDASQTGACCKEALWQQFIALGANRVEVFVQRLQRETGTAQGQMPGREEGRRNSEDEQEQDKASQQLALSAPSGCNEGTPASSLELDLPRVRVHMVKAEEQGSQVQQRMSVKDFYQTPQLDVPQRKKMLHRRTCEGTRLRELVVKKKKTKRETARVGTHGPLKETAKVATLVS